MGYDGYLVRQKYEKLKKKCSSWCNCEETRDEFGGCVPTANGETCWECGKKIPKNQLVKYKKRMLKESGWDKEFEDEMITPLQGNKYNLISILTKYLNLKYEDKVKIKCKPNCIQIERIK